MNQHYVPQFLLRNFADKDKEQIWAFDKLKERFFQTSIRNIAAEKDFYDVEIDSTGFTFEPTLGASETEASTIFERVIGNETLNGLSKQERATISLFASAQMLRVKYQRDLLKALHEGLKQAIITRGGNPAHVKGFSDLDNNERLDAESIHLLWDAAPRFAEHFATKVWVLFKATTGDPFYISDNPITIQNTLNADAWFGSMGLASQGVEIYLPLSNTLCLAFLCPTVIATVEKLREKAKRLSMDVSSLPVVEAIDRGIGILEPASIMNLNSLQVLYSSRFVFSHRNNFELVQSMIDEHPECKKGLLPTIA